MPSSLLVMSVWIAGCTPDPDSLDQDGDGFLASDDWNDLEAAVNPDSEDPRSAICDPAR